MATHALFPSQPTGEFADLELNKKTNRALLPSQLDQGADSSELNKKATHALFPSRQTGGSAALGLNPKTRHDLFPSPLDWETDTSELSKMTMRALFPSQPTLGYGCFGIEGATASEWSKLACRCPPNLAPAALQPLPSEWRAPPSFCGHSPFSDPCAQLSAVILAPEGVGRRFLFPAPWASPFGLRDPVAKECCWAPSAWPITALVFPSQGEV